MSDPIAPEAPGVTAPPAEPAAPAAPVQPAAPAGSEPVQPPSEPQAGQSVPYERFSEVNTKAKEAEDRAAKAEQELEEMRNSAPPTPAPNADDDDIDPEVEALVDKIAKKKGYLTQDQIDAQRAQDQVKVDVVDLREEYKSTGIPFDDKAVMQYAQQNGIIVGSKEGLRSAYLSMNHAAIVEAERNRAIDSFKNGGNSAAEKPGGTPPPKAPEAPAPASGIKGRVAAARAKLA